jgi:kynurenine formamidase
MALIDLSGPISTGMWHYGQPYLDLPVPPVRVEQIEFPEPLRGSLIMDYLQMASQTGTYLETARHVDAGRDAIDRVPLERAWLVPTVVLHTPKGPREKVTLDDVERSLDAQHVTIEPGDAALIHTGWDREWSNAARYLTDMPYVSRDVVHWLIEQRIGIWGADTPRADSPDDPQGFFGDFFATDILLLAPLVNLDQVTRSEPKPRLVALPLKLDGACASPVRAILTTDD